MIRSVFPRLFGSYMEGQIITARWQHTASGSVWTRITTLKQTSHQDLVVVDRGTGLLTLTFPKCRVATFLGVPYLEALGDAITDVFTVTPKLLTPSTGTVDLVVNNYAATPAIADPADAAILVINMYIGK
jgi:hypothetical protein